MRRVAAIARNTFREAARSKVLYSLLFFAIAMILAALALGQLSVHEDERMIVDVGLFGIDLFSVLIAIFVGVNLLYKELALKTVHITLCKPIARWEFLLGKWLGVMATLAVQVAIMGAVLMLTLWASGSVRVAMDGTLSKAVWLLFMNVTVVTSVAMWFSSFSSPFSSGLCSLGVFAVGRSIFALRQLGLRVGGVMGAVLGTLASLLPNLQLFYPSGTTVGTRYVSVHGDFVGARYLGTTTAYALGYSALILLWAMWIFGRRDFI